MALSDINGLAGVFVPVAFKAGVLVPGVFNTGVVDASSGETGRSISTDARRDVSSDVSENDFLWYGLHVQLLFLSGISGTSS